MDCGAGLMVAWRPEKIMSVIGRLSADGIKRWQILGG